MIQNYCYTLLISIVTMIPTVIIFIILWKYHSTIPFNKRSTITYLSLLLICSIISLILISVCWYISLILLLLNLSGYSFDTFHFVCLTGEWFCSFSKSFVDSSVCSFLQLLLFLIMEKDAMKYLTRKVNEFKEKGSIQRNTLRNFEKRQRKMNINKNANVHDIFVIELD